MDRIIAETQTFTYIKLVGREIQNYATNTADAKIALKELRLLKKIINAEKKQVNNQLRDFRAQTSNVKGMLSIPKTKILPWARFGVRAITAIQTTPLENLKTEWNSLLLQCDRIQIQLERL